MIVLIGSCNNAKIYIEKGHPISISQKVEVVGDNIIFYMGSISMMGEEIYRKTGLGEGGIILSENDVREKINKIYSKINSLIYAINFVPNGDIIFDEAMYEIYNDDLMQKIGGEYVEVNIDKAIIGKEVFGGNNNDNN